MSAAKRRVRWLCPNGCPAVLGPTRPPIDAVCRYCLRCSTTSRTLVTRTAPALERQARQREQRRERRAAAKRARRDTATRVRRERKKALAAAGRSAEAAHKKHETGLAKAIALRARRRPLKLDEGREPWRSAAGAALADIGYAPEDFRGTLAPTSADDWLSIARTLQTWRDREQRPSERAWRRDLRAWEYADEQRLLLGLDDYEPALGETIRAGIDCVLRRALRHGTAPAAIKQHARCWLSPELEKLLDGPRWARERCPW